MSKDYRALLMKHIKTNGVTSCPPAAAYTYRPPSRVADTILTLRVEWLRAQVSQALEVEDYRKLRHLLNTYTQLCNLAKTAKPRENA
jgi:hypothetical protein